MTEFTQLKTSHKLLMDTDKKNEKRVLELEQQLSSSSQKSKHVNEQLKIEIEELRMKNNLLENERLSTKEDKNKPDSPSIVEENERRQQEWKDKIRILEQENMRLRDRSLRAERLISEQNSSSSMKRNTSSLMNGVNTISWFDQAKYKEEDVLYDDLEAPSYSRKSNIILN